MSAVTFLTPGALWALGLLLPLVGLYVLRARRQRARVGSTMLWAAARRDALARSPWKRLTPEVSLFLEVLGLLAAVVALARPAWRTEVTRRPPLALVLDASASMLAREGQTTRESLARTEALSRLAHLAPDTEVLVVEAGPHPRVLANDTRPAVLRAALAQYRAHETGANLTEALTLATERLQHEGPGARIVVLTDGVVEEDSPPRAGAVAIEVRRLGAPADNRSIARVELRVVRVPERGERLTAFALLVNHTAHEVDTHVHLRRFGSNDDLASAPVHLRVGQRAPVALDTAFDPSLVGQMVTVSLDPGDALRADDVQIAAVPPHPTMGVTLVTDTASTWLERALTTDASITLRSAAPGLVHPGLGDALVLFDGVCPSEVPAHDAIVFAPPSGHCHGVTVGARVEAPAITSYATSDPRFRFLSMDGVHARQSATLTLPTSASELLRAEEGVLMADLGTGDRALTVVGFAPAESDWPLQPSFVVFVRNVVELARRHRDLAATRASTTGVPLRWQVDTQGAVTVRGPDGALKAQRVGREVVVADALTAGVYTLQTSAGAHPIAVNLHAERESRLASPTWSDTTLPAQSRALPPPPRVVELGPWLCLLAGLLFLADLLYLTRPSPHTRTA